MSSERGYTGGQSGARGAVAQRSGAAAKAHVSNSHAVRGLESTGDLAAVVLVIIVIIAVSFLQTSPPTHITLSSGALFPSQGPFKGPLLSKGPLKGP